MENLAMNLTVLVGGLLSGAIGFVVLGLSFALLLVPYLILYRRSQAPRPNSETRDARY